MTPRAGPLGLGQALARLEAKLLGGVVPSVPGLTGLPAGSGGRLQVGPGALPLLRRPLLVREVRQRHERPLTGRQRSPAPRTGWWGFFTSAALARRPKSRGR